MKCLCSDVRNAFGRTRGTFQLCRTVHIHLCPVSQIAPTVSLLCSAGNPPPLGLGDLTLRHEVLRAYMETL